METIDREQPDGRLGQLKDAAASADVEARIVDGALARTSTSRAPAFRGPRRWLVPAAATAAAATAVGGWAVWTRAPGTLAPGAYAAQAAPARFTLGAHEVELAARSSADFIQTEPSAVRIALRRGALDCDVDPLPADGSFEVRTEHARVSVVGTRFAVEVDGRCSRVRVREGTVRVEDRASDGQAFVLRGGDSRELCAPEPAAVTPAEAPAPPLTEAEIMRAALDHMAAGDPDAAIRGFEAYLEAHPQGGFVEDAMFHRAVLLLRGDDPEAARDAVARFAARYPDSSRTKTLEGLLQK